MSHINLFNFKLLHNIRTNTEVIPQDGGIDSWDSDSQLATHCLSIKLKYPPLSLREADFTVKITAIHGFLLCPGKHDGN